MRSKAPPCAIVRSTLSTRAGPLLKISTRRTREIARTHQFAQTQGKVSSQTRWCQMAHDRTPRPYSPDDEARDQWRLR